MSATIDRYLAAVNTPKRRGRKVSQATLVERLGAAQARVKTAAGVDRVLAAQEVRDLTARIAAMSSGDGNELKQLEADFVRIAKAFGEKRGIGYGAWRDAGVPAVVLKRAGIARDAPHSIARPLIEPKLRILARSLLRSGHRPGER